jgi:hypothetical protein
MTTPQDFDDQPGRGTQPIEGDDTGAVSEPEEFGSLTVEDDPQGTIDPAEMAGTADESDEDVR